MAFLRHVRLHVLLEMVAASKLLSAGVARIWTEPGVDALVARQFLVAGEGLAAGVDVALEGAFACKDKGDA